MPDSLCRALSGKFGMTHVALLDCLLQPLGCCGQMRIFTLGLSHFQVLHRFLRMLNDYTGITHVAVLDGFLGMIKRLGDMRADLCQ